MKDKSILYLVHSYNAFQKDQIEILAKHFNHVYVLVRYKPITELYKIFPLSALRYHTKRFAINTADCPHNVTVIPVPLWYLPTNAGYRKLGEKHFLKALKIINAHNFKFDLIHAHFTWTAGYAAYKIAKIFNVPYLLTVHEDNDYFNQEYLLGDVNIENTWKNANAIIRVNKASIPVLKEFNDNVLHIPNGFNSSIFKPLDTINAKKQLGLSEKNKLLLSCGGLETYKGHTYLIEAIKILAQKHHHLKCIIIGDGVLKKTLLKKIKHYELQDIIRLTGAIPHKDLNVWMNACDLFVLPSISESFGIVQLEAMACGKPVVATRNGGSEEVIVSYELGLLCQKQNPQDLSQKMEMALNKQWNKELIVDYAKQFDWEKVCGEIKNIYVSLLNKVA
ncbi:MAG: glycosyltransferase [Bacteroidales bacterium]|nr:glycosyltransferase [Bacteroidales bacterium]